MCSACPFSITINATDQELGFTNEASHSIYHLTRCLMHIRALSHCQCTVGFMTILNTKEITVCDYGISCYVHAFMLCFLAKHDFNIHC